jgi:hypothetical protein
MDRQIIFDQDEEQEGLLYDVERANREGLMEHMTIRATSLYDREEWDVEVTPELMDALSDAMDLSVNLEPGRTIGLRLQVIYQYRYGRVQEPITT